MARRGVLPKSHHLPYLLTKPHSGPFGGPYPHLPVIPLPFSDVRNFESHVWSEECGLLSSY